MARRIYIKDGGLNTSSTIPPGYTALGTNGGDLKKKVVDTISDIGGGSSTSKTRVDVVSAGVKSGVGVGTFASRIFAKSESQNLLWEVVDSSGEYLISDQFYTDLGDLLIYVNILSLKAGIDITVKGYYYLDQSKEKFRIVGRNGSYWSLVGLNNYARMKVIASNIRIISPGTWGQNIINSLISYQNAAYGSGGTIGSDGKGLIFPTHKSDKLCKNLAPSSGFGGRDVMLLAKTLKDYNSYGIDSSGNYISLYEQSFTGHSVEGDLYISGFRNGGGIQIFEVPYSDQSSINNLDKSNVSLLKLTKIKIYTNDYPSGGGGGLTAYIVSPIGQDVFLLNNNKSILSDDNVYLIPESKFSVAYPYLTQTHIQIDNTGFGNDLSDDNTKTGIDRYSSIRFEEIGDVGFGSVYSSQAVRHLVNKKSIKWRVAYGKNGNYTLSDDYILIRGNGICVTAMVNK